MDLFITRVVTSDVEHRAVQEHSTGASADRGFSSFPLISSDWPLPKLQEYFKDDTLALIGYGSQGHGQGLNARDNGLNVIVGVREGGESWKQAQEDGWVRFLISLLFCSSD